MKIPRLMLMLAVAASTCTMPTATDKEPRECPVQRQAERMEHEQWNWTVRTSGEMADGSCYDCVVYIEHPDSLTAILMGESWCKGDV